MRESCAEFHSFKLNYVKKVVFPLEILPCGRYGIGGLSWRHQSGVMLLAAIAAYTWSRPMDDRPLSARLTALRVRDNRDSMVSLVSRSLYPRHRPNNRHCDDDFVVYFSRVLSLLCGAGGVSGMDETQSIDLRDRSRP